jgi:hypothetical protein
MNVGITQYITVESDKECREPVSLYTGCRGARLLEWLILNDRVQPSFIDRRGSHLESRRRG